MPDLKKLQKPLLFWSLPFGFLSFALPIFSRELGASALEVGGLFSISTCWINSPAILASWPWLHYPPAWW